MAGERHAMCDSALKVREGWLGQGKMETYGGKVGRKFELAVVSGYKKSIWFHFPVEVPFR